MTEQEIPEWYGLRVHMTGAVVTVALDLPLKGNAVDRGLHTSLCYAFRWVAAQDSIRAVILATTGSHFSRGGSIQEMLDDQLTGIGDPSRSTVMDSIEVLESLLDIPQPVVAAVRGDAIGVGATLALACDVIVAETGARFADPHVKVGLTAGDGGAPLWTLLVGPHRAKRYLLTGDILEASEAAQIGLITDLVNSGEADERAMQLAQRIASHPVQAIRWTKELVNTTAQEALRRTLRTGAAYEELTARSPEHEHRVRNFVNRNQKHNDVPKPDSVRATERKNQ